MTKTNGKNNNARSGAGRFFFKYVASARADLTAHLLFWPLFLAGLAFVLWIKSAVLELLKDKSMSVTEIASALALVAISAIFFLSGKQRRIIHIALGLFGAGVTGNLYDRFFNDGLVRDFIDVYYKTYHWPAFNVADSLLCIAVGLLIVSTFITEKPGQRRAQQQK